MKLHPFKEVASNANKKVLDGHVVFQKWICEHCSTIQTMETPNIFYTLGKCEECEKVTNIERNGCNFLLAIDCQAEDLAKVLSEILRN